MSKKMDKLNAEWMALVSKVLERHDERISSLEQPFLSVLPIPDSAEPPVGEREYLLPVQHVEAQHLQKGDVESVSGRVITNITKLYEIAYDDGTKVLRAPTQWHYIECRDEETKQ